MKKKIERLTFILFIFSIFTTILYVTFNPQLIQVGKEELIKISPYFLASNFILFIGLLIFTLPEIKKATRKVRRKTWLFLAIILIVGFSLREFIVPHTHRVFFDEDLYLGVANSLATEFRNILCNYGTPTHCIEGILNKDPSGFPFLASILFKLFGPNEEMIFQLSVFFTTLSILFMFLFTYFHFQDESIALFSALLFSLTPVHLVWSGSVATEIYFTFFSLVSLSAMALFIRKQNYILFLLSLSAAAYAAQIRPEGILFMAIPMLYIFLTHRKIKKLFLSNAFWLSCLFVLLLLFSQLIQLSLFKHEDWGAPGGRKFGLDYFKQNLEDNIMFWFQGKMHPISFSALCVLGAIFLFRKDKKMLFFLLLWFMMYFVLFTSFYAGSVLSGGIGSRYVVMYITPSIILSAFGLNEIFRIVNKKVAFLILIFILISLYPTLPFITTADKQAQYVREMHDFVMSKMDEIDSHCWVLTHNPSIFLVAGKNSLQTWFGSNKKVMESIFNESDCIMWLEGAWCLFEPHKSNVCKYMHDNYKLEVFARLVREENPEQVFTLYKVYRK